MGRSRKKADGSRASTEDVRRPAPAPHSPLQWEAGDPALASLSVSASAFALTAPPPCRAGTDPELA